MVCRRVNIDTMHDTPLKRTPGIIIASLSYLCHHIINYEPTIVPLEYDFISGSDHDQFHGLTDADLSPLAYDDLGDPG